MRVFISHSGKRSKTLATELHKFIRKLVPSADPWISTGIDKGSRWEPEIAENLEQANVGIVCLTADNLDSRWLLFESGALSKRLDGKVCTFLLDVEPSQITPPLSQFQHTKAEERDVWALVETINRAVEAEKEKPRDPEDLKEQFEMLWPKLDEKISELRRQSASHAPDRSEKEILSEVLDIVREVSRRRDTSAIDEKTLQLVGQIYREVVHDEPPSLKALHEYAAGSLGARLAAITPGYLRKEGLDARPVPSASASPSPEAPPENGETDT